MRYNMGYELKLFAINLLCLLLATPLMGWVIMRLAESFEKSWKTNIRRKKWMVSCGVFMLLAVISGWLI
jgi:hypothetical protein